MKHAISVALLSLQHLSSGVWVIASLFVVSGLILLGSDHQSSQDMEMWVFSPEHQAMYAPMLEQMNRDTSGQPGLSDRKHIELSLVDRAAIKSRMMSGFFGGLPTADLIEVERATVGQVFMGPSEAIGFLDLTDRLKADGLYDQINPPSLSPWSLGGRVYGLPHDVHPVMLAYRADLVEAAGIDLNQATTWEKFFELLKPITADHNNDGRPDRYAMSFWVTQQDNIELLLLQGGGQLFDSNGVPTLDSDTNARLLATMVLWCAATDGLVTDIDEFGAAGHQARVDGDAIAYLCPDWMCSIWKMHVPGIRGKMKLMPLPAFSPGGLRTSVRGGTMLGIPKTSEHIEQSWEAAKLLYTSPEVARELYQQVDIVTPIRSLWNDPVYDIPDPFFMDQPKGRMYLDLAPDVPIRSSSPYNYNAVLEIRDAAVNLLSWANANKSFTMEAILPQAESMLRRGQESIERQMSRNAFSQIEDH